MVAKTTAPTAPTYSEKAHGVGVSVPAARPWSVASPKMALVAQC